MSDQATLPDAAGRAGEAGRSGQAAMSGVGRHAFIYGMGAVLAKGVGFLMLPVYTRFLTPADYGVMELIEMTLDVISIIAGVQIALGIFRYYHKADTAAEKHAVVSTALVALGISYSVVGTGAFFASDWLSTLVFGSPVHGPLVEIAGLSIIFQGLLTVPLSYAQVQDRSVLFVGANLVRTVIALGLNILFLVILGMGVKGILLSGLMANGVVAVAMCVLVVREVGIRFSRRATRDLLRYGAPLIATQLATFLLTFGDRYFLQAAADSTAVGLYSLSYQFGFILAFFGAVPFMRVWNPRRFEVAGYPNRDEIYARGFIYLNVLLLTMALGIGLFVEDMLRVMATPAFHGAAAIVPVLLVAYILQSWTSLQDIGILVSERTEYIALGNWLAALTAIVGYALLIPRFLGWGAAVATVVAFAVRHLVIFSISQHLWPVRYRWKPVLRLSALALLVFALGALLPELPVWSSLLFRSMLMSAYLAALWRLHVLSEADRATVRSMARRIAGRARDPLRSTAAQNA